MKETVDLSPVVCVELFLSLLEVTFLTSLKSFILLTKIMPRQRGCCSNSSIRHNANQNDSSLQTDDDIIHDCPLPECMELTKITGNDAVNVMEWLSLIGLGAPHSFKYTLSMLWRIQMSLSDVAELLDKLDFRTLHKVTEDVEVYRYQFFMICCALEIHLYGRQKRAYWFYKLALQCDAQCSPEIHHPLILHSLGMYKESNLLLPYHLRFAARMQAVNCFYLEKYRLMLTHCRQFGPFLKCSEFEEHPWTHNAVFGIYVFGLIQIRETKKAKLMLMKGMKDKRFRNNAITLYCASVLKLFRKEFVERTKSANEYELESHMDIFNLFKAMHLHHHGQYMYAIERYHQCNFFAAHPIHYYRLYQCYLEIGLYVRALRCLRRAESRTKPAKIQIPSITNNYSEKVEQLQTLICTLQCQTCRKCWRSTEPLYPCSLCLSVWYCSKRCQKIGWKAGAHREQCSKRFVGFKGIVKDAKRSMFAWNTN